MAEISAQKYKIHIGNTGEEYVCSTEVNLLRGMEYLSRKGIPVGCRNGGCGVCKIRINSGEYRSQKMSRAYVTREEEEQGIVLACRVYPRSDIQLDVLGKMVAKFVAHGPAPEESGAGKPGHASTTPPDAQQ